MTKSSISHTPQDHDFQNLIVELRRAELDHAADALVAEVGREWQQGSSTVMKRSRFLRAQTQLVQTVNALRQGQPTKTEGYKLELAQSVADALEGKHTELREPPQSADDVESLLRAGTWVILGFEGGKFQASAGEDETMAGSWQEALTMLANKLSQKKGEHASGEYSYRRP